MQTGTILSTMGHAGLIAVALFGGSFRSDAPELAVQEVSVITGAEFAALTARPVEPDVSAQPAALQPPEAETVEPTPPAADATPEQARPSPSEPPSPDPVPEVTQSPDPEPEPVPQPIDRVAPVPVPEPVPEAKPDDVAREEVSPDAGEARQQKPQEATAPEAASDRIVTEAAAAPKASIRPKPRRRPAPTPEPPASDTSAAINSALAEALTAPETPTQSPATAPSGPPLSSGEREGLRVSVSKYWNVGSLSSEALATTVVVSVRLAPDGTPDIGSIRLLSSSGGSGQAARQAFEAARRAIIRAGSSGFDLPAEKYAHWQEIEMTFNPERMRIK